MLFSWARKRSASPSLLTTAPGNFSLPESQKISHRFWFLTTKSSIIDLCLGLEHAVRFADIIYIAGHRVQWIKYLFKSALSKIIWRSQVQLEFYWTNWRSEKSKISKPKLWWNHQEDTEKSPGSWGDFLENTQLQLPWKTCKKKSNNNQ